MPTPAEIEATLAKLPAAQQDQYLAALPQSDLEAYAGFSTGLRPESTKPTAMIGHNIVIVRPEDVHEGMSNEELAKLAQQGEVEINPEAIPSTKSGGFLNTGMGMAAGALAKGALAAGTLPMGLATGGESFGILNNLVDKTGAKTPQNDTDRLVSALFGALGGAGAMPMYGGAIGKLGADTAAEPVTGLIAKALSTHGAPGMIPRGPVLGSILGAEAGQMAANRDASPQTQLIASLAASLAPGAAATGLAGTTRRIMRGGDTAPLVDALDTFGTGGTTPSVGQATGGHGANSAESFLSKLFGSSSVIRDLGQKQEKAFGQAIENRAEDLSPAASNEAMGETITGDAKNWMKTSRGNIDKVYQKFYDLFPGNTVIPVSKTQDALANLTSDISGAPNLSTNSFLNPDTTKYASLLRDMQNDVKQNGGRGLPFNAVKEFRSRIGQLIENATFDSDKPTGELKGLYKALSSDQESAAETASKVPAVSRGQLFLLESAAEESARLRGRLDAAQRARKLIEDNSNLSPEMKANYLAEHDDATKEIQTQLGQAELRGSARARPIADAISATGQEVSLDNAQKAVQRSENPGVSPIEAYRAANAANQEYHQTLDTIRPILGKKGGPEQIFKASLAGTAEGGTVITNLYKILSPENQKVMTAAILRRAAKTRPTDPEEFDMNLFAKNYTAMQPTAKETIFGSMGPTYREDLDKITKAIRTVQKQRDEYQMATSAGQGNVGIHAAIASPAYSLSSIALGYYAQHPVVGALISTALPGSMYGGRQVAKWMTNPKTVRWLAQNTKLPPTMLLTAANTLVQQADREHDPDMKSLGEALLQQSQGGQ